MTFDIKQQVMDSLVGKPFVLLPGNPPDHKIVGEYKLTGEKIRAEAVMQVFNDMLLMDAIEGVGEYRNRLMLAQMDRSKAGLPDGESYTTQCLDLAERLYGVTCADALKHWLTLRNIKKAVEWPGTEAM